MKIINNEEYLKIGEVSKLIKRTPQTIKNWYEWAELNDALDLLPHVERVGERGIRYFRKSDMKKMHKFKNKIKYGTMSDFNQSKWGNRNIETKRTIPFKKL